MFNQKNLGQSKFISNNKNISYFEEEEEILKKLAKNLRSFGLTSREAKIYVHLARFGPKKANKVSEELNTHRTDTYHTLTSLQNKGLVSATLERPIRFIALPMAKAIEKIIKVEKEKISFAEKRSKEIFNIWSSLPNDLENIIPPKQFQILEGSEQAYNKLNEIEKHVKSDIKMMISYNNLRRLDQTGIIDKLKKTVLKENLSLKILLDNKTERDFIRKLQVESVRFLPNHLKPVPNFIIMDNENLLFFTSKNGEQWKRTSIIWTNYDVITKPINMMFSKIWEIAN